MNFIVFFSVDAGGGGSVERGGTSNVSAQLGSTRFGCEGRKPVGEERPDLFWGVVNSMYIGNVLLLILSLPLVGIFVRILRVRPAILAPITALITILGVYTIRNSVFDIFLMIVFGVIGYLMKKTGFEPGPMVLAFVLGSLIESSFRRSMLIFEGDATGFVTRPISGAILAFVVLVIASQLIKRAFRRKTPASDTTPETVQREDSLR